VHTRAVSFLGDTQRVSLRERNGVRPIRSLHLAWTVNGFVVVQGGVCGCMGQPANRSMSTLKLSPVLEEGLVVDDVRAVVRCIRVVGHLRIGMILLEEA
jgi:hypothetical protein